jgi:hypothetical protein
LLCPGDSAEYNLAKAPLLEGAVGDTSDDLIATLDNGNTPVVPVKYQSCDIFSWHLGKLSLKDIFKTSQDYFGSE